MSVCNIYVMMMFCGVVFAENVSESITVKWSVSVQVAQKFNVVRHVIKLNDAGPKERIRIFII